MGHWFSSHPTEKEGNVPPDLVRWCLRKGRVKRAVHCYGKVERSWEGDPPGIVIFFVFVHFLYIYLFYGF